MGVRVRHQRVKRMSGQHLGGSELEIERIRKVEKAVQDVQEPDRGPVTEDVVKALRDADLVELAEVAEHYASK